MLTALTITDVNAMSDADRRMSFAMLLAVMPLVDVATVIYEIIEDEDDRSELLNLIQTHGVTEANI